MTKLINEILRERPTQTRIITSSDMAVSVCSSLQQSRVSKVSTLRSRLNSLSTNLFKFREVVTRILKKRKAMP